jgi:hypothetical protein
VRRDGRVIETQDVRKLRNCFSVVECYITWAGFQLLLNDRVGIGWVSKEWSTYVISCQVLKGI